MSGYKEKFGPRTKSDVVDLVVENPLAWIVSGGMTAPAATLLPLRPVLAEDGTLTALTGHFARSNPQATALQRDPQALVLLLGPHGYISASWMADRTQASTWNYASAWFAVELTFFDDETRLKTLLTDLIAAMEKERPHGWSSAEMGPRYEKLARGIIGFEARIVQANPRFKLGQDERDDVYGDIRTALSEPDNEALLRWMERFNPGR
jgi:predicted FMN-binding regulatory protein PaiB